MGLVEAKTNALGVESANFDSIFVGNEIEKKFCRVGDDELGRAMRDLNHLMGSGSRLWRTNRNRTTLLSSTRVEVAGRRRGRGLGGVVAWGVMREESR